MKTNFLIIDEIAAIILDPGTHSTRIGYAGEDAPRMVLPSFYGEYKDKEGELKKVFDENMMNTPRGGDFTVKPILKDSIVQDWDLAVEQWLYSFDELKVSFDSQPLLMTEPVWNTKKNKVGSFEAAFEYFKFPAFFAVKNPTSISFAHGRPNCLVVEVGHDITTLTPVIDGLCLIKSTLKTHYAGAFIDQQLRQLLAKQNTEIIPTYKVKSKIPSVEAPNWEPKNFDFEITESFDEFQKNRVLNEMKETLLQVSKKSEAEKENEEDESNARYFEFPNGLSVNFSDKRFKIANSLFEPSEVDEPVKGFETAENGEFEFKEEHNIKNDYKPIRRVRKETDEVEDGAQTNKNVKSPDYRGLSELITSVLSTLDVDLKAQVANNIILTGATSLIPGLTERLQNDLNLMNPSIKIRIHATGNTYERKYSSFIGSSILASLGTFHQLWVSKQEYEEVGVDRLLLSRFK